MSELQQTNGGFIPPGIPSSEAQETSAAGSKRQRRPSVRLGEIGGDDDSQSRRPKWRQALTQSRKSPSKTRTLTNLSSGSEDPITVGSWRVKKWVKSSDRDKQIEENRDETEQEDERFTQEEEDGFGDFSREDSESPVKEQTVENHGGRRRRRRQGGVRMWLQGLGLGRYWPMFEMHEVDEQVLPLLTLDDLKDIGINAVGSRRKMFVSIQKLQRDFS